MPNRDHPSVLIRTDRGVAFVTIDHPGCPRALEIVLGADLFDARTAERYGGINRAMPQAELDGFVEALALRIAGLSPGVLDAARTLSTPRSTCPCPTRCASRTSSSGSRSPSPLPPRGRSKRFAEARRRVKASDISSRLNAC